MVVTLEKGNFFWGISFVLKYESLFYEFPSPQETVCGGFRTLLMSQISH